MKWDSRGRRAALAFSMSIALVACSSDDPSPPPGPSDPTCTAANRCTFIAAGTAEDRIHDWTATAKGGDRIQFGEGTFVFRRQMTLPGNVDRLTVGGAGIDKTILDFAGQTGGSGSDAIYAQNVSKVVFEKFTVKDSVGNAIKVLAGTDLVFRDLKTHWTGEDPSKHGSYGIYPVQSSNILIERTIAIGASDTGIYVGQSRNIIVRNNEAYGNVAGIEIENSFFADVYDNDAHDNAGGIFVFDVPDLPQFNGHDIRVHRNKIRNNNIKNFAPSAGLLAKVPRGTGFFVLGNANVEVTQNTFENNKTAHTSIISWALLGEPNNNNDYKQYPEKIHIHDNTYIGGGDSPDLAKDLGRLLTVGGFPDNRVPPIVYDGIVGPTGPTDPINPREICLRKNEPAAWVNLHMDKFVEDPPNLASIREMNPDGFACELPPVAAVSLAPF